MTRKMKIQKKTPADYDYESNLINKLYSVVHTYNRP